MKGIKLNKLRVEGKTYRRTLDFHEGLNIISGDIYSGKSLVLRLIDFIFGKGEIRLNVQKALDKYCDKVLLEIEIDSKIYTICRKLKKLKSKFYLYYCEMNLIAEYTPKVMEQKEYSILLMDMLDIPKYKLLRHKKRSQDKELESISIRDILRYVYVDQHDLGTHNFLKKNEREKYRKNKYTFDIMMNLVEEDTEGVKESLADIINEINANSKMIQGLMAFLKEGNFEEKEMIEKEKNAAEEEIFSYTQQKLAIINKIKNNKPVKNPISEKLFNDKNQYLKINQDIKNKIEDIKLELNARNQLLRAYENELKELSVTKEVNYRLETINHINKCPLCKNNVENCIEPQSEELVFEGLQKELEHKTKMLKSLIDSLEDRAEELRVDHNYYANKILKINNVLDKYNSSNENSSEHLSYIEELEAINRLIFKLTEEVQKYQEALKVHNKIEEKEQINIKKEKRKEELEKKVDGLIKDNAYRQDILKKLNDNYILFLEKLGYNITSEDTYINENDYIPYYNGANVYEHDSGGVLVCVQIAYLGAILVTACTEEKLKHPNFLMLDTIGKYLGSYKSIYVSDNEEVEVMDEKTYKELYVVLKVISEHTQIILVDNTPPTQEGKYIRYIFKNKSNSREAISEEGLIDLSKNELVSQV